jgi:hypothetical protein
LGFILKVRRIEVLTTEKRFYMWVQKYGQTKLAEDLGIVKSAVTSWFTGVSSPRLLTMQKIITLARGEVSYDDVINETKNTRASRRMVRKRRRK